MGKHRTKKFLGWHDYQIKYPAKATSKTISLLYSTAKEMQVLQVCLSLSIPFCSLGFILKKKDGTGRMFPNYFLNARHFMWVLSFTPSSIPNERDYLVP